MPGWRSMEGGFFETPLSSLHLSRSLRSDSNDRPVLPDRSRGSAPERRTIQPIQDALPSPFRFIKEYLLKSGFRDGMPGLIIVVATMFYVFVKYAKFWS